MPGLDRPRKARLQSVPGLDFVSCFLILVQVNLCLYRAIYFLTGTSFDRRCVPG